MQRGYTLLFSVITASLVLGVAVFILSISAKQYELSAAARNSVYSFYAADTGIECMAAAYGGVPGFGTVSTSSSQGGTSVTCNSQTVAPSGGYVVASAGTYPSFLSSVYPVYKTANSLDFALGGGTCANVTVYDGYDASRVHYIVFDSRGYNFCTAANRPEVANPSTVERALRLIRKG